MKRVFVLASAAVLAVGCGSSDAPPQAVVTMPVVRKAKDVAEPLTINPTKIGLLLPKKPLITVGYPAPSKLFDSFRDPAKQSGSEFNDLPANFKYPFRARTWETAHSGFGEILFNDDLVAAMYQEDRVTQERVDEIIALHNKEVGAQAVPPITGKKVSYWFWDSEGQRLMICAFQTEHADLKLTLAMGDDVVMDALGISPTQATIDAAKVDAASGPPPVTSKLTAKPEG